ncbi:MAG TPA: amidase family protein, partial [Anaerolineaceae bacterium]|nr:amidase family protein [Anaerolineaceae bacterium]
MRYTQLSANEIAQKVQAGELKASDMLDASLAQIHAVDGDFGRLDGQATDPETDKKVHAFISLTEEMARAQAQAVDAKVAKGEDAGLLAGVPVSIKDIFALENTVTTAASRMLHNYRAPYTASAVQKLMDAGALIVGKVNLDEFTFGSSNESSAYQPASNNPWNPAHVPGGSSGGSAAAVAAEETPLSLGTDTGGSIRQPAAFCGVVGLKPSYGRISRYGLIAFASSLDCPGPLSRNVEDAALMLQVMAGADERDESSATLPVPNYLEALQQDVKGMRIGLSPDYAGIAYPNHKTGEFEIIPVQEDIKQATLDATEQLARQGAEIIENVPMPHTRYGIPVYFVVSRIEASSNLNRMDGVKYGFTVADARDLQDLYKRTRTEGFGPQPKLRILMGAYLSAASKKVNYYQLASQVRGMIRRDFE